MEQLIIDGRLRASREVRDEVERENDSLLEWVRRQPDLWVESDEDIQAVVSELMTTYHDPEKPDKGINGADPFVIAVAAKFNPSPGTVVSAEKPGSAENPKIPWVCGKFQPSALKHLSFLELVLEEEWELN
jgi:hypothetical protein